MGLIEGGVQARLGGQEGALRLFGRHVPADGIAQQGCQGTCLAIQRTVKVAPWTGVRKLKGS